MNPAFQQNRPGSTGAILLGASAGANRPAGGAESTVAISAMARYLMAALSAPGKPMSSNGNNQTI